MAEPTDDTPGIPFVADLEGDPPALTPAGTTYDIPDMVTLAEAAQGWDVSVRTLRRRIAAGEITGARRIHTRAGQTWHLPISALSDLGYTRRDDNDTLPAPTNNMADELAHQRRVLDDLMAMLDAERRALAAAQDGQRSSAIEAAELRVRLEAAEQVRQLERQHLEAERDRMADRVRELEAAKPSRWRRRKQQP